MTDNWESKKRVTDHKMGADLLRVTGLASADGKVKDASFAAREGEILGIFGLSGSGRTELLEAIYGLRKSARGEVMLNGQPYHRRTPRESLKRGMVLICEDRRGQAIVESLSIRKNTVLSRLDHYARA